VLLLASYIACFGLVAWYGASVRIPPALDSASPLFAPVFLYMQTDFPGAVTLSAFYSWCLLNGSGIDASWDFCQWQATNLARYRQGQPLDTSPPEP